tara:strand:- start:112 stop:915 length:804 start_codon:yes stop_codon:yes gene_type:complete
MADGTRSGIENTSPDRIHNKGAGKIAVLYRMVMEKHVCPYGLKSLHLLKSEGFEVHDHYLKTRDETDAFKAEYDVKTTPQTFINDERIGGYDALAKHFGKPVKDPNEKTYAPIIALFGVTALMALAAVFAMLGTVLSIQTVEWFIAFSMCALAIQKLRDLTSFSTMFLGYDLLARRWVRYAWVYPFAELGAGVLMIAGVLGWISGPVALFIGAVGGVSVYYAVYVQKRDLKCACMGGDSNVPLGAISLTENVMMVLMGLWTIGRLIV